MSRIATVREQRIVIDDVRDFGRGLPGRGVRDPDADGDRGDGGLVSRRLRPAGCYLTDESSSERDNGCCQQQGAQQGKSQMSHSIPSAFPPVGVAPIIRPPHSPSNLRRL